MSTTHADRFKVGRIALGRRIRATREQASLSLSNEPLLYVDGVRVNNAPATGFANQSFGSASIPTVHTSDLRPAAAAR